MSFDFFICHASEDKDEFVRPLAQALKINQVNVWYDEFAIRPGESIRHSIDRGLAESSHGIVILSKSFFKKGWTKWELGGLVQRQNHAADKLIIPIWHKVTKDDILAFSPSLVDVHALNSARGLDYIVFELLRLIRPEAGSLEVDGQLAGRDMTDNLIAGSLTSFIPENVRSWYMQLENNLETAQLDQANLAYSLANKAHRLALSGKISEAKELYEKAVLIYPAPRIINKYGLFLTRIGAFEDAERTYKQLLEIIEITNDEQIKAITYSNLGRTLMAKGDLNAAMELFIAALALDEEEDVREGIARNCLNLGLVYRKRGELEAAYEMSSKSLSIYKELGNKEYMATALKNLGIIRKEQGDIDSAEILFNEALCIDKETGRKEGLALTYRNLGMIFKDRKNLNRAEEMQYKALAIDKMLGKKEGVSNAYRNLGDIYLERGDVDLAESKFKEALDIDKEIGRQEGIASDYRKLGILYEKLENRKLAETMLVEAMGLFNKIGNEVMVKAIEAQINSLRTN